MPTLTRESFKSELAHHPFELVGARVDWKHHYMHVKRILEGKIARGETAEYVKPKNTIPISEIYSEPPRSSDLTLGNVN